MALRNSVFIVDDDEQVLETLCTVFFFEGFKVQAYSSAKEFLDDYKPVCHSDHSCLILDLKMPELSGLELQTQLAKKQIQLPIVFLSGASDLDSAVQAMTDGAFTFLQKPVDNKKIIATVNSAIERNLIQQLLIAPLNTAKNALNSLSSREREIAFLISEGLSASTIAEQLCISFRTVEAHKANVFHKLNLNTIAQLTKLVVLSNYPSANK